MVDKDLGMVTAYAYAVSKGYTGTEEEFAELMADYADVGQRAEAAATAAAASATAASGSASDSAASATAAEGFAGNASTAAGSASQAAQNASQSATAASGSATSAAQSATAAAGSATTASTKASEAAQSATQAAGSATAAESAKTAAQTAQTAAETAQTAAEDAQAAAEDAAESIEESAAQIDENTQEISLVKSQLEAVDATLITEEASGTIASFTDGADGYPMRSVEVSMEPIQDLHGQANPYPAGGGKNLLEVAATSQTINGVTFTVNADGTVTANGTATATAFFELIASNISFTESTILNGCPSGGGGGTYAIQLNGMSLEVGSGITIAANTTITSVRIRVASGATLNNVVFKPMIRLASVTDATYAPYSNICPISGWQSVTVTRAGKNLYDSNFADYTQPTDYRICPIKLKMGATYSCRAELVGSTVTGVTVAIVKNGDRYSEFGSFYTLLDSAGSPKNGTFTVTSAFGSPKLAVYAASEALFNSIFENYHIQLEESPTATAYEPYTTQTVTLQLGQTVYGGTVDVVSGEMVVDRAMVTYDGSENWYTNAISGGVKYRMSLDSLPSGIKTVANNAEIPDVVTNLLPAVSADESWRGIDGIAMQTTYGWRIYYEAFNTSDAAPWKAFLAEHPLTIAYKLAQPITITLTPEQLTTVLGQNNVWSDANSVTVDYVADTKLYIQKAISAAVAALS